MPNPFHRRPLLLLLLNGLMCFSRQVTWEVRQDDVFPLANEAHAYWSGYFTSRPGLKRQVRFASNFLNAARQMEQISGVTAAEVNRPTTRPSPPVGDSWTDSMEGAIGVATHHDGMSGTERQDVSNDYAQRVSECTNARRHEWMNVLLLPEMSL